MSSNSKSGETRQSGSLRRFFLLHLKPTRLPEASLRFARTFGLGGSAAVLFVLLAASGMLLTLVYEASPERAYDSVSRLYTRTRFGGLVRNIHHFSANLLIAVTTFHMLRTFFTGAFHGKRRVNWVVGVLLLFGVMGASFTGYLLPWDQLAYWAITISTGMLEYVPGIGEQLAHIVRGGEEIGPATLVLFYALHTTLIPIALLALMGFHFWRVRKAGGVVIPRSPEGTPVEHPALVPADPHLLVRELGLGLLVIAAVLVLSLLIDAPLGAPASAGMSPNPSKAPWYFVGFQELQLHLHPVLAVVVLPFLLTALLISFPYLKVTPELSGPWFLTRKGLWSVAIVSAGTAIVVPALLVMDDLWLRPATGAPSFLGRGIIPLGAIAAVGVGLRTLLRRLDFSKAEVFQALFAALFVAVVAATGIGFWFRGKGMALIWPF